MTNKQRDELRQKWTRWLDDMGNELGWLLTGCDFFWGLQEIVRSNNKIQSPAGLHNWIADNYVAKVSTSIVRLTDRHPGTISLFWLITEIAKNPDVITRDYFVSQWHDEVLKELGFPDKTFDEFAGPGERCVNPERLKSDKQLLAEGTRLVKDFRNQWVAHFDSERKIERMPTFGDLDEALGIIDCVWCDYERLLTCSAPPTRKPALAYDWKEPLRYPWIEMSEEEKQ
ncbi:MAG: hypothetical protein KAY65_13875 [Planctomycetes bacterium]|nr:hypothetical protein [Planctomycetota bacterium]